MPTEDNKLTPLLYDALELAFRLHGHDARKKSNVPVMAHLLSVCALVQLAGGSEEEAMAALLHDAREDKPKELSREQISQQFGEKVLNIIEISSDTPPDYAGGPKLPWRIRKEAYIEHIYKTDPALLRVTVADKIDNVRAILADLRSLGNEVWEKFNAGKEDQLWYYTSCVKAFDAAGFKGPLLEELRKLVAQLIKKAGKVS
jgi:(p)ppGpp synthase/HD superfamily hydrolase